MKKFLNLKILIILVLSVTIVIILFLRSANNKTMGNSELYISYPLTSTKSTNSYTSSNGFYSYSYPINWTFRNGREGIGLVPSEIHSVNPSIELLTIFSDISTKTAKDWAIEYDGSGYREEMDMTINGYQVYYVLNETDLFTDIKYTFSHNGVIVHSNFRLIDKTRNILSENQKYKDIMEEIVRSIKFLN